MPGNIVTETSAKTQNVWIPWKADTPDQMSKAVEWDSLSGNFDLELFIRDRVNYKRFDPVKARLEIVKILTNNFNLINIFQKEALVNSKLFPEIDFLNFRMIIDRLESIAKFDSIQVDNRKERQNLTKANKIELVFIRATRNDETQGLASCLCRSELLEAIVRLATNVYFAE